MWFWNLSHNVVHAHVYLLPSLAVGIGMVITGLVHKKNQDDRQEKFEKELSGEMPETPASAE